MRALTIVVAAGVAAIALATAAQAAIVLKMKGQHEPTQPAPQTHEYLAERVGQLTDGEIKYPVQLKELPPEDLNPGVALEQILGKLNKYSGADDLSVVLLINRRMTFEYRPWASDKRPNIKELWYFGCISQDQSKWFLYGSVLANMPRYHEFDYPVGKEDVA
jgi:hypothetical protein